MMIPVLSRDRKIRQKNLRLERKLVLSETTRLFDIIFFPPQQRPITFITSYPGEKALLKRPNKLKPKFMVLFAFIFFPPASVRERARSCGYLNVKSTCVAAHRRFFTRRNKKWQVTVKHGCKFSFQPAPDAPRAPPFFCFRRASAR